MGKLKKKNYIYILDHSLMRLLDKNIEVDDNLVFSVFITLHQFSRQTLTLRNTLSSRRANTVEVNSGRQDTIRRLLSRSSQKFLTHRFALGLTVCIGFCHPSPEHSMLQIIEMPILVQSELVEGK